MQLKDLKQELGALRVAKVTGGAPNKLSKMYVTNCWLKDQPDSALDGHSPVSLDPTLTPSLVLQQGCQEGRCSCSDCHLSGAKEGFERSVQEEGTCIHIALKLSACTIQSN